MTQQGYRRARAGWAKSAANARRRCFWVAGCTKVEAKPERLALTIPARRRARRRGRPVDSDLAESLNALKQAFERRGVTARFAKADPPLVEQLRGKLRLPRRYREFLLASDPVDAETL